MLKSPILKQNKKNYFLTKIYEAGSQTILDPNPEPNLQYISTILVEKDNFKVF